MRKGGLWESGTWVRGGLSWATLRQWPLCMVHPPNRYLVSRHLLCVSRRGSSGRYQQETHSDPSLMPFLVEESRGIPHKNVFPMQTGSTQTCSGSLYKLPREMFLKVELRIGFLEPYILT